MSSIYFLKQVIRVDNHFRSSKENILRQEVDHCLDSHLGLYPTAIRTASQMASI